MTIQTTIEAQLPSLPTPEKVSNRPAHYVSITEAQRERFLHVYGETGSFAAACWATAPEGSKTSREMTWRNLQKRDPEFAQQCKEAESKLLAKLMRHVNNRVFNGDKRIIVNGKGVVTYEKDGKRVPLVETKFSDALTLALLRKLDPSFNERMLNVTHKGNINHTVQQDDSRSFVLHENDLITLNATQREQLHIILQTIIQARRRTTWAVNKQLRESEPELLDAVDVPFEDVPVGEEQSELDKWLESEGVTS